MNRRTFITQAAAFAALGPAVAHAKAPLELALTWEEIELPGCKGIEVSIPRALIYIGDYDVPPAHPRIGDCWFDNVQRKFVAYCGEHLTNVTDLIVGVEHHPCLPPRDRVVVVTAYSFAGGIAHHAHAS